MKDASGRQWWFVGPDSGADINGKPVDIKVLALPPLQLLECHPCAPGCLAAAHEPDMPRIDCAASSSDSRRPAPFLLLQFYGRTLEKNASCKTYVASNAGCSFSWSTLAGAPSGESKWIFDPVPGGNPYRWYIRMHVRMPAPVCFFHAAFAITAMSLPGLQLHYARSPPCSPK